VTGLGCERFDVLGFEQHDLHLCKIYIACFYLPKFKSNHDGISHSMQRVVIDRQHSLSFRRVLPQPSPATEPLQPRAFLRVFIQELHQRLEGSGFQPGIPAASLGALQKARGCNVPLDEISRAFVCLKEDQMLHLLTMLRIQQV